jgi:hypothetical protein
MLLEEKYLQVLEVVLVFENACHLDTLRWVVRVNGVFGYDTLAVAVGVLIVSHVKDLDCRM